MQLLLQTSSSPHYALSSREIPLCKAYSELAKNLHKNNILNPLLPRLWHLDLLQQHHQRLLSRSLPHRIPIPLKLKRPKELTMFIWRDPNKDSPMLLIFNPTWRYTRRTQPQVVGTSFIDVRSCAPSAIWRATSPSTTSCSRMSSGSTPSSLCFSDVA